jgi:hypothetical protein
MTRCRVFEEKGATKMDTRAGQDTVQPQSLDYNHVKARHIEDSVTTTLH